MTSELFLKTISNGLFDFLENEDRLSDLSSRKENAWSDALATFFIKGDRLPVASVRCNKSYPGQRTRYDLLVNLTGGISVYAEVKGIWKSYWCDLGNAAKHQGYLFAPLNNRKSDKSAAMDLQKLATIVAAIPGATLAAQLIVGSAKRIHQLGSELDLYESLSGINEPPWSKARRCWQNHAFSDYDYDARLYVCDKPGLVSWWKQHGSKWS